MLDRDETLFEDAGIDGVLTKPLHIEDLRSLMRGQVPHRVPKSSEQPVDEAHFNQVQTTLGPARLLDLLAAFDREFQNLLAQIATAAGQGAEARTALATAVHSVAGSAAMLGVRKLRNDLNALENLLLDGDELDPEQTRLALSQTWQTTSRQLQALRSAEDRIG